MVRLTKKEKCKELMAQFFGPASASVADTMTEENCVAQCRSKVAAFLGEDKAKAFDNI